MANNLATREMKSTESDNKIQALPKWGQNQIWLAALGFWVLAWTLSSVFTFTRKFPDDLFVVNWLPWFMAAFFAMGWLLTHWLEIVASKKQKRNVRTLNLVILLVSLFFFFYFEIFVNHQVLSRFGFTSFGLIISGSVFRFSSFHDESFLFLRESSWLRKS